jgi:hypothetical protein
MIFNATEVTLISEKKTISAQFEKNENFRNQRNQIHYSN